MHNFQTFLKSIRESKELEQNTISDAINLSIKTIQLIEEGDNDQLLQSSSSLLKNQIRRYCEYLEIPEKKIVSILNKIDVLYYKQSRYGKLKTFDYINRTAILIIAIAIITLVSIHIMDNIYAKKTSNLEDSKSSIIYTPINYNVDVPENDSQATHSDADINTQTDTSSVSHQDQNINQTEASTTKNKSEKASIAIDKNSNEQNITDTPTNQAETNSEKVINTPKKPVAHPPITANMSNMVIDTPDSEK